MNYKSNYKNGSILTARLSVIQQRVHSLKAVGDIAQSQSMHRNTVRNIMKIYESTASPEVRNKILSGGHFSLKEIQESCQFLLPGSRKPHAHPNQATVGQEQMIRERFEDMKIGTKRMRTLLSRKDMLGTLTVAQMKGVYKRNGWRVAKVRTKNGETRSLYDYQTIGVFEDMHYDTKVLADQKSLPDSVYENLKYNEHLPIYEWNIMDAATRTRFIGYSRGKSTTFGLQFLLFVLSHIRFCGCIGHIRMHTDGGVEFFSGSEEKQKEWNSLLLELDADIDCYNPNWDIRKNLIERSHRSDDEEFLIPFGGEWKSKKDFMLQAIEYSEYWNTKRSHSGHGMDGRTPKEQLINRGLPPGQVNRILDFRVLYLDDSAYILHEHFQYFRIQQNLRNITKDPLWREDRKGIIDFLTQYPEENLQHYAQNVLTQYLARRKNCLYISKELTL